MECCERWRNIKMKKHQTFTFLIIHYNWSLKIIYFANYNNISKKNINPLMPQSVQYFLLSHLSPTQTNWMIREHTTYNYPCEKHDVLKSKLQTYIVWPWDLLIVIANAKLIGNWRLLNCIGTSVGIIGIFAVIIYFHLGICHLKWWLR
jgi:hypothetical protein